MGYLWDIGVFLVVLAELVFFHELGHFLAAKLCGVFCDRFSIGMPPRLFGFRWGETDYCIGALPIGGYVKMAGQEDVPQTDDERRKEYGHVPPERWLTNKPRWQRAIVFAAGPLMNVVLGIVLYGIVAAVGADVPETKVDNRIGMVEPGSPAEVAPLYQVVGSRDSVDFSQAPSAAGWRTGDRIASINGSRVTSIGDVAFDAVLGEGEELEVEIERTCPDGTVTRYLSPVAPRRLDDERHARFGVAPFQTALVSSVRDDMPAAGSGIQPDDIIVRANGRLVDTPTFIAMTEVLTNGETMELELERDGETIGVTVQPAKVGRFQGVSFWPPLNWGLMATDDTPLEVAFKDDRADAFFADTDLGEGDVVTAIDGQEASFPALWDIYTSEPGRELTVTVRRAKTLFGLFGGGEEDSLTLTVAQIAQAVTEFDIDGRPEVAAVDEDVAETTGLQRKDIVTTVNGEPATAALLRDLEDAAIGEQLALAVERPSIGLGLLQEAETREATLEVTPVGAIGIAMGVKTVFYRVPLPRVVPEAIRQGLQAFSRTVRTVVGLLTGGLSPRDLGGPVLIYQVTTSAARSSFSLLLEMTAFISINLCVFNLLPLPVLDGGHLVLLGVEAIRRKPLDVRIVERVQQFGLLFIIALFLFITVNDISRILSMMVP
ncbi:MAG: PDZ domain-containing protein [bacterium]|nr:PDZ domain-containing protein [bacterium]